MILSPGSRWGVSTFSRFHFQQEHVYASASTQPVTESKCLAPLAIISVVACQGYLCSGRWQFNLGHFWIFSLSMTSPRRKRACNDWASHKCVWRILKITGVTGTRFFIQVIHTSCRAKCKLVTLLCAIRIQFLYFPKARNTVRPRCCWLTADILGTVRWSSGICIVD